MSEMEILRTSVIHTNELGGEAWFGGEQRQRQQKMKSKYLYVRHITNALPSEETQKHTQHTTRTIRKIRKKETLSKSRTRIDIWS